MSNRMRRFLSLLLPLCLVAATMPLPVSARGAQQPPTASLAGVASNSNGQPLANAVVQLRNVANPSQVIGTATTNAAGEYIFTGLPPGTYIVETTNEKGEPTGASEPTVVAEGQAVTGVGITVAVVTGAAAGGGSNLLAILLALIGAAGVAGATAFGVTASPSS